MAIFTHVAVGTNDLAKSRAFYDAVLAPLGYKRLNDLGDNGSIWGESAPEFFVLKPANHDSRSDANSLSEVMYRVVREGFFSDEVA